MLPRADSRTGSQLGHQRGFSQNADRAPGRVRDPVEVITEGV
jgi:hypothetical protein